MIFTIYPYMKRFTALAHFGVGLGMSMAPLGGYFAASPTFDNLLPAVLLCIFTIFWGAAWEEPAQSGLVPQLNQFFDFILTSSLIDLLAEYSVPGQAIGHGSRINTRTITASEPGGGSGQISDAQIQHALQGWIADGTIPQATGNMLYFVYLPPEVTSILGGHQSCQPGGFCGYHNQINGTIFYAVEPFIACPGCTFGRVLDSLTKVSSHELCEAITDPALNGWFDDTGNEIGDICNRTVQQLGVYTIQLEWSNQANECRLAPATAMALQEVLLYDQSNGQAATGQLDSSGMFQELHEFDPGTFKSGWTHITS